jgi:hypothetical protein
VKFVFFFFFALFKTKEKKKSNHLDQLASQVCVGWSRTQQLSFFGTLQKKFIAEEREKN